MIIKKIANPRIKEKPFIVTPIPFKDELLTSWLTRTAYAHHTHPHTFMKLHLGLNNQSTSIHNLDAVISKKNINILKIKTANTINIFNMSLKSYNGYLQEDIISNGLNKFLCNLRFCPICLREDKVIYFRKQWKVVFHTICPKHKCFLQDHCPSCNKLLSITKMYQNKQSFKYCYNCGFELRKSRKQPIPQFSKLNQTIKLTRILKAGYIKFKNKPIYSFIFFDTIAQLCKLILKYQYGLNINNKDKYQLKKISKNNNVYKPIYYQISIQKQFLLFNIVTALFKDYPKSLIKYIKVNRLTHWKITKDMYYVSFWFENVINSITPRIIHISKMITNEEIYNGKKHLLRNGKKTNKVNLSHLLGCNFLSSYNKLSTKI